MPDPKAAAGAPAPGGTVTDNPSTKMGEKDTAFYQRSGGAMAQCRMGYHTRLFD